MAVTAELRSANLLSPMSTIRFRCRIFHLFDSSCNEITSNVLPRAPTPVLHGTSKPQPWLAVGAFPPSQPSINSASTKYQQPLTCANLNPPNSHQIRTNRRKTYRNPDTTTFRQRFTPISAPPWPYFHQNLAI
uniref:(northern house mosquito) hypothetical protein n=1 Tax=Culex pipiens TaxID=7175 RepID=A0A8D8GVZ1_CULPI